MKLLVSRTLLVALVLMTSAALAADYSAAFKTGKAELKSAGPLAFGPEGILFVGDPAGGAIVAIDTGDRKAGSARGMEIAGLDAKVAALLGTAPDQILINDLAVNPVSRKAYLSVSRGRGPDAIPVLVRLDAAGKLEALLLDDVRHSRVALPNLPESAADARGQNRRLEAITDLAFVNDRVIVAGLSNEEFASKLRSIPFPFQSADSGTSIEIFHGNHGRLETNAPVRTFLPYEIAGKQHILAAYTCTPLVKFAVSDLKPGAKVMGTTIAELGNRNRPLDMVAYRKEGKNFILMNNSSRGVMKLQADGLERYTPITQRTDITGVPYQTLEALKGVQQLDLLDTANALLLVKSEAGSLDLKSIPLP